MVHTYSYHSMNPLPGIYPKRRSTLGYRYASPDGEILSCGSKGSLSALPQAILNSEFLILNWTYTFSAKEKDAETGLSYFGSRYYSSDLSVWLSVDPMSDKYPSFSPYVYCADNPVKLVDPNGEEIYVGDDYYYRNGYLYYKGTEDIYVPEQGSFEEKALNALNTLRGTKQGRELMKPFEGTDERPGIDAKIKSSSKSEVNDEVYDFSSNALTSLTINWNSNGTELPTQTGMLTNAAIDLGHEFSHAFDAIGNIDYIRCYYPYELTDDIIKPVSSGEWKAVYRENLIRGELGLPYRTHYIKCMVAPGVYKGCGPYMLQNDKPYFPNELKKQQ